MGITAGTSLESIKTLIESVKTDASSMRDTIANEIQAGVVDALADKWYAQEAIYFMNSLGSTVYALTSEIAVQVNTVIFNIAGAYDAWLRATAGEDTGDGNYTSTYGDLFTIQSNAAEPTSASINGAGGFIESPLAGSSNDSVYYSTTGGNGVNDSYSYMSSEDTCVKINVDSIKAVSENSEIGIDVEEANNVAGNLSTVKQNIADALSQLQTNLDASAALIDAEGKQSEAVSGFYAAVMNQVNKMFDFLIEGEYSLQSNIQKASEKYGTTITTDISSALDANASGE